MKPTYEMLEARVALLKECHDASNEALRSAMLIADREGKDTDWAGHRAQLRHALDVHHAATATFTNGNDQ